MNKMLQVCHLDGDEFANSRDHWMTLTDHFTSRDAPYGTQLVRDMDEKPVLKRRLEMLEKISKPTLNGRSSPKTETAPFGEIERLNTIPDVTRTESASSAGKLEWVGMSGIEVPIRSESPELGSTTSMGCAEAYVSLDNPNSKGIHMSRLYLSLQRHLEEHPLQLSLLSSILSDFLVSHQGLSESAFVSIAYDHVLKRQALITDNRGWRRYPVKLIGVRRGSVETLQMSIDITYSSTCPCSAALARQAIQERFAQDFEHEGPIKKNKVLEWLNRQGTFATPHGQRSVAQVSITAKRADNLSVSSLIDLRSCLTLFTRFFRFSSDTV